MHTQHHQVANCKSALENCRLLLDNSDILDSKCEGPQTIAMLRLRIVLDNVVATIPTMTTTNKQLELSKHKKGCILGLELKPDHPMVVIVKSFPI